MTTTKNNNLDINKFILTMIILMLTFVFIFAARFGLALISLFILYLLNRELFV